MSGPVVELEHHKVGRSATAAVVRLNRPEELNPIDAAMLQALDTALDEVVADRAVRMVLVTGAGRAFSAGGDMKKYRRLQRDPAGLPPFRR